LRARSRIAEDAIRWAAPEKALWPEVYSPEGGVTMLAAWYGTQLPLSTVVVWCRARSGP
jgi:hypothetical protein